MEVNAEARLDNFSCSFRFERGTNPSDLWDSYVIEDFPFEIIFQSLLPEIFVALSVLLITQEMMVV